MDFCEISYLEFLKIFRLIPTFAKTRKKYHFTRRST